MNGQNGTEFDWYVNDRLSSFMVFYNDEANLGAVKLYLNRSATADVFLYGEQGKKFLKQVTVPVEATEQELLELAVLLRREADDKRLWDADIEALNTDDTPTPDIVAEFRSRQGAYTAMRDRVSCWTSEPWFRKKFWTRAGKWVHGAGGATRRGR